MKTAFRNTRFQRTWRTQRTVCKIRHVDHWRFRRVPFVLSVPSCQPDSTGTGRHQDSPRLSGWYDTFPLHPLQLPPTYLVEISNTPTSLPRHYWFHKGLSLFTCPLCQQFQLRPPASVLWYFSFHGFLHLGNPWKPIKNQETGKLGNPYPILWKVKIVHLWLNKYKVVGFWISGVSEFRETCKLMETSGNPEIFLPFCWWLMLPSSPLQIFWPTTCFKNMIGREHQMQWWKTGEKYSIYHIVV